MDYLYMKKSVFERPKLQKRNLTIFIPKRQEDDLISGSSCLLCFSYYDHFWTIFLIIVARMA